MSTPSTSTTPPPRRRVAKPEIAAKPDTIKLKEVAALFECAPITIQRRIEKGEFPPPPHTFGGGCQWPRARMMKFHETGKW